MLLLSLLVLSKSFSLVRGACGWNDSLVPLCLISLIAQVTTIITRPTALGTLQITITGTRDEECSATPFSGSVVYTASPSGDTTTYVTTDSTAIVYASSTTILSTINLPPFNVSRLSVGQQVNVVSIPAHRRCF
jgi:hypothetical protein